MVSAGTISVAASVVDSLYVSFSSIVAVIVTGPTTRFSCGIVTVKYPSSSVSPESSTVLSSLNVTTTFTVAPLIGVSSSSSAYTRPDNSTGALAWYFSSGSNRMIG